VGRVRPESSKRSKKKPEKGFIPSGNARGHQTCLLGVPTDPGHRIGINAGVANRRMKRGGKKEEKGGLETDGGGGGARKQHDQPAGKFCA